MQIGRVIDSEWGRMPLPYRLSLLARFHWRRPGLCLAALWHRCSPHDVMMDDQRIRFVQFGGDKMSDRNWERFLNEMPTDDFVCLMLSSGSSDEDDTDSDDDDDQEGIEDASFLPKQYEGK